MTHKVYNIGEYWYVYGCPRQFESDSEAWDFYESMQQVTPCGGRATTLPLSYLIQS